MIREVVDDGIRGTRGAVVSVDVAAIAVVAVSVVIPIPGPVATGVRGGGSPLSPALLSRGCWLG
ncbi:Uncharacterised protein [Acidipropionibacterium jensenii]|uniref:Uncharacterized protein n=1 Tax=Acidipropionibacterium jensenii TaxID=1749 RepID=A0A3S4V285_9ACTN|nr:Uncharacterised protein [Acidipropionibacterium jensenii]